MVSSFYKHLLIQCKHIQLPTSAVTPTSGGQGGEGSELGTIVGVVIVVLIAIAGIVVGVVIAVLFVRCEFTGALASLGRG